MTRPPLRICEKCRQYGDVYCIWCMDLTGIKLMQAIESRTISTEKEIIPHHFKDC